MAFEGLAQMIAGRNDAGESPAPAPPATPPAPAPLGTPVADPQAATLAQFQEDQQKNPNAQAANAPPSKGNDAFVNPPPPVPTPVKATLQSKVLGLLGNFASGFGEGMMHAAGVQTPLQRWKTINDIQETQQRTRQLQASEEHLREQTTQMSQMVTLPNGMSMPMGLAMKLYPTLLNTASREKIAGEQIASKEHIAGEKLPAQVTLGQQYVKQIQSGDSEGAAETLKQINALGTAVKGGGTPSMSRWVNTVNDPNATPQDKEVAAKNIRLLQGLQTAQQEARGRSFAYNRGLYQWQAVTDENGQIRPMQGWEIIQNQKEGKPVIASGRLGAKDQVAVQQLSSEATPAIAKVRENVSAYDNASDRAIFARVIHDAGIPRYGQEAGWMGNILNQALKEGLSPQGQALARDLSRLNETVGRFRTIMGAPSTDTQMALAMAMLPGPSTPDSKYAQEQLNNFEQMVSLGVNVPIFGGGRLATPKANTPPPGAKVRDYTQVK